MVSELFLVEIEICIFQINRFIINSAKTYCALDVQKFNLRESEQFYGINNKLCFETWKY